MKFESTHEEMTKLVDTDPNTIGFKEPMIQEENGKNRWGRVYERKRSRKNDVAH